MADSSSPLTAPDVARQLAAALEAQGHDYAIGGAIALSFWGDPRGTIDVDLTLFLPMEQSRKCLDILKDIGCQFDEPSALASLNEHGFCKAACGGLKVDVFLASIPFYEEARRRRSRKPIEGQEVWIWDAETLAVFKMMFFRLKDLADIEQILRARGSQLDRAWVRQQLESMYGRRDPRVARWDELVAAVDSAGQTN
jgi:hypothetical protein